MKSLSVCLIFFLVLFTISGDCGVVQRKCIPSDCDAVCKVEDGTSATGYCRDGSLGCYCKFRKDYSTPWQCVPATCDKLCKAQEGAKATGLCKYFEGGCFCETNTSGH